jgi:hypothetical protein
MIFSKDASKTGVLTPCGENARFPHSLAVLEGVKLFINTIARR